MGVIENNEQKTDKSYAETRRSIIEAWNKKYLQKEKELLFQIDKLIKENSSRAYKEICEMFDVPEGMSDDELISIGKIPIDVFKERNEFSYLIQAVNIYYTEENTGVDVTVFDHGECLQDIIDVINQVRFILWELEFLNSEEMLIAYITETQISPQMLAYLVKCSALNKHDMALALADAFHKAGKFKYELQMLFAANDLKSGDGRTLKKLADLYKMANRDDLADKCLSQIKLHDKTLTKHDFEYSNKNVKTHKYTGEKIAFILCVNNSVYAEEALFFINRLEIPEGCEIEVFTIEEAKSMTAGYNEGMKASDAKYKVYLHQDVMILNKYFIYDILDIFKNPKIGMIGMVGAPQLSESKVMWYSKRIGKIYTANAYEMQLWNLGEVSGKYEKVETVDGLLIATQYDILWREDLFDKWDMYDVSQSFEFHKEGYDVVVPAMANPWCLHDDGFMNLSNYYGEIDKMKKEYF